MSPKRPTAPPVTETGRGGQDPSTGPMSTPPDPAATFEVVDAFARHAGLIFRALQRLGVPRADVEDAVQDVFLIAHRRRESFDGTRAEAGWLYGIARRVASHRRRALGREQRKRAALPQPSPPPTPEQGAAAQGELAALHDALAGLEPARREVVVLTQIEGMTAPEVAAALGVKLNTIYSRLRLGRRDLVAALSATHASATADVEAEAPSSPNPNPRHLEPHGR